jgi:hypothetical protein
LSTNYKYLNTLFSSVNNFLKKWPGRLVTLQHLVLFRDTLIYFSYYRILNLLTSQRNRTFSEQSRPLLYHAMRTSTCQISIAWLESNQRPVLIHTFTVSFTIIVSTDLPLNYTQSKMVGAVGLAPTKAVRPGDLQSPAIAAMRYSQKQFGVGLRECLQTSLRPITRYLV